MGDGCVGKWWRKTGWRAVGEGEAGEGDGKRERKTTNNNGGGGKENRNGLHQIKSRKTIDAAEEARTTKPMLKIPRK